MNLTNKDIRPKPGYYLKGNTGNNSFAYRKGKKLWIPPVILGDIKDIKLGDKIAFEEMENGELISSNGLESHVWIVKKNFPPIFVCDNHNRVLESWKYFKDIAPFLIHVDQHRDEADYMKIDNWENDLRICDYINWAKDNGWIQKNHTSLCESADFKKFNIESIDKPYILNIDIDIFAPEQTLIPHKKIIDLLKLLSKSAVLVSIASSPLFIDQEKAIQIITCYLNKILMEN